MVLSKPNNKSPIDIAKLLSKLIKEKDDYLQVCGALMAVTRNMYEKALGTEQTKEMFLAVADRFDYQQEVLHFFKDMPKPTIH